MMWYWNNGNGVQWWGWLLMVLAMVVFWGIVIWAIVHFVRLMTSNTSAGMSAPNQSDGEPERILAQRFAAGDIDEEEFHGRLDVLRRRKAMGSGENG